MVGWLEFAAFSGDRRRAAGWFGAIEALMAQTLI